MYRRIINVMLIIFSCLMISGFYGSTSYDTIDITDKEKGLVYYTYSDARKSVKILVEKDGKKIVYSPTKDCTKIVPLQMGTGKYKVSIVEHIEDMRYRPIETVTFDVEKIDEKTMFMSSSTIVDLGFGRVSTKAISSSLEGLTNPEKILKIYNDVVRNYQYDYELAENVPSWYTPKMDDIFTKKKAICYGYSVLFAGLLRNEGIPVKVVTGYKDDIPVYHAWNEVLINGEWHIIDTTYDASMVKGDVTKILRKNSTEYTVNRYY